MFGLLCYFGTLINYHFFPLFPAGLMMIIFWLMKDKTQWYKKQFLKYSSLGVVCSFFVFIYHFDITLYGDSWNLNSLYFFLLSLIKRKSFFSLSVFGLLLVLMLFIPKKWSRFATFTLDKQRMAHLMGALFCIVMIGILFDKNLLRGFGLLWFLSFLSLIPLEWIFQSISRLRSKRNFIFLIYVLVCLLDSHFEGRVRRTANFFKSTPAQTEIPNP